MGTRGEDWSEQEMLRVLAFYAGQGSSHSKGEFEKLCSKLSNRTEASVVLRLGNYVARDFSAKKEGKVGLVGGGTKVDSFWSKFALEDGSLDLAKLLRACSTEL
jgi:hypothetical protein